MAHAPHAAFCSHILCPRPLWLDEEVQTDSDIVLMMPEIENEGSIQFYVYYICLYDNSFSDKVVEALKGLYVMFA